MATQVCLCSYFCPANYLFSSCQNAPWPCLLDSAGGACGCKSRSFWGLLAYQVIRSDFLGFSPALHMALPVTLNLSRLQPLAQYLAQGADIDSGLMDMLQDLLPEKQVDNLAKLLDKLLQEPNGARVLTLAITYLLDEWLREGGEMLTRVNKDLDPYTWLATSDHLEVVQTFRELL
jgi:hypothetical protein